MVRAAVPSSSTLLAPLAALLLTVLPVGCATTGRLTPSVQNSFGTRTFAAPYDATFQAARDALTGLGYTLGHLDPGAGRIVTTRRPFGVQAEIGLLGTGARPLYRQYDLQLVRVDAGHTRVVAVPRVYEGERDVSRQRTWLLDGPEGERTHWKTLFATIEARLPPATTPRSSTASPR